MATIYLGTRRYSSWSLRGWLAVKLAGLDVEEHVTPLAGGNTPGLKDVSPSGMVPCLVHNGIRVWESLAIVEYCAEMSPLIWPGGRAARAHARAIAAEMHAGFRALRLAMPMNLLRTRPGPAPDAAVRLDLDRIEALWRGARAQFGGGGPFLFGPEMNGADAMYAPVVARLLTYRPKIAEDSLAYCEAVRAHPLMTEWYAAAAAEPDEWRVEKFEAVG